MVYMRVLVCAEAYLMTVMTEHISMLREIDKRQKEHKEDADHSIDVGSNKSVIRSPAHRPMSHSQVNPLEMQSVCECAFWCSDNLSTYKRMSLTLASLMIVAM